MMFETPKLIFIHMPKTGGSSIETYLNKCQIMKQRNGQMGQHATLQRGYELLGSNISDYNMFTVVRNTYERILSLYCFFYVKNGSGFVRMGLKDSRDSQFLSFPEYYTRLLELHRNGLSVTYAEDFFFYCGIDGDIPDNLEVIRFDQIENDFKELWVNKWKLDMPIEFPHTNDNKNVPADDSLREYLGRDPKFIEAIDEIYDKEIQYFGFKPPF